MKNNLLSSAARCVRGIRKLFYRGGQFAGDKHQCYICKKKLRRFIPYGRGTKSIPILLRELRVVGSDVDNFSCPYCDCTDRERHLNMYFDEMGLWSRIRDGAVLHFAPEIQLSELVKREAPKTYIRADLKPRLGEIQQLDITDIAFPENSFDVLICNHVLEHLPDDTAAFHEIARVLKPGGIAIVQTPFSPLLDTSIFSPLIDSDVLRQRYYGEVDHFRLYGKDLFNKFKQAGLELTLCPHDEVLKQYDYKYYGVNPEEDLILVTKTQGL